MAFWDKWINRNKTPKKDKKRKYVKTIKIQASYSEGEQRDIILESLLTGRRLNISIPGTINAFTSYESQVSETYRKYNGLSDFGCQQTRAVIDLRTAFISGEGLSVSAENKKTRDWIEKFLNYNKLHGINLTNGIKGTEIAGQTLFLYKPIYENDELNIKIIRLPYSYKQQYKPVHGKLFNREKVLDIMMKTNIGWESLNYKYFVYVRTGGDDTNNEGPVTKVGVVLTDIENYDRAIKDLRRLNHILARITPVWETSSDTETAALKNNLNDERWKIGQAFIGKAKFRYETPGTSAHENLISELTSTIKSISAVTGVPVHWLGYVDLMSNRATAKSLYENIKAATSSERIIWEEAYYYLILNAMQLYIDNGGTDINYDKNFQVRLPLISLENFLEIIRALNIAYGDKAISIDDYMNFIPGIDPIKTRKAIDKQEKKDQAFFKSMGLNNFNNITKGDENEQSNNI